ncbi:hypothetical protein D3C81_1853640 [compost metagenome]
MLPAVISAVVRAFWVNTLVSSVTTFQVPPAAVHPLAFPSSKSSLNNGDLELAMITFFTFSLAMLIFRSSMLVASLPPTYTSVNVTPSMIPPFVTFPESLDFWLPVSRTLTFLTSTLLTLPEVLVDKPSQ